MSQVDIIIPAKNEQENIPLLFKRIHRAMRSNRLNYRVILVDDRSTDSTVSLAKKLQKKYPINIINKAGKPGKAFSILEGFAKSKSDVIVMIDADLQYPPEIIPQMVKKSKDYGVVIANRKVYKSSYFRRLASRANALIFGRLLFGLNYDIQSGLKLFKREVRKKGDTTLVGPWSLDIPLLYTAKSMGVNTGSVNINFEMRKKGSSKITFINTAMEISLGALRLRIKTLAKYGVEVKKLFSSKAFS